METAAKPTSGKRRRTRSSTSTWSSQRSERVAKNASTTGPRSASWHELRMSLPRTPHAFFGSTCASPSSFEPASGTANGGSFSPFGTPREPGASVPSVLSVM